MAWVPVAASIAGGMMSQGGRSSTQQNTSREPWAPATPWLTSNVNRGQQLQDFYTANPFSNAQKTAYGNQFALSDSYRQMLPSLLSGMNTKTFDRSNPTARPDMQSFAPPGGNLGLNPVGPQVQYEPQDGGGGFAPNAPAKPAAAPAVDPAIQEMLNQYKQQQMWKNQGS